jgi:hypothetical protein
MHYLKPVCKALGPGKDRADRKCGNRATETKTYVELKLKTHLERACAFSDPVEKSVS